MKKILSILLVAIFSLTVFGSQTFAYTYPNGKASKAGDILVTSDTVASGIAGHVGMVVDSKYYLEIKGQGYTPNLYLISSWFSSKETTKIARISDSAKAASAAEYAKSYAGSGIPYKITTNLLDNTYTYCSKLVYQAYAWSVPGVFPLVTSSYGVWAPYAFLNTGSYTPGANPKLVYSKGMSGKGNLPNL